MNRALRSFLFAAVFAVAGWAVARTKGTAPPPTEPSVTAATPTPAASSPGKPSTPSATAPASGRGFRSADRLADHYGRHGREFGSVSPSEYVRLAQQLRDAPTSEAVLEIIRSSDGVISRFDRNSGAFLAADRDGTIRTFFKPNDGEAYFRRQARRAPRP